MLYGVRKIIAAAALAFLPVSSHATVLTFEDLPTGLAFFLSDYHGFTFGTNNIATTGWFYTDEVTPFYTPQSPTHFIATDFNLYPSSPGDPIVRTQSITSAVDFIFNGAWFTGENQIRYELYNNGVLVSTSANSAALTDSASIFVSSGYGGLVDEVVVFGRQGFYALDDFTYNVTASVPEPTSVALVLLAGVAGFCGALRRRQHPATASC